ncbi:MAG: hypothetical protein D4S02_11875 [Rhodocyclaceae bacterium]|nr:MAG: hypothetical protein D4S02_11875 [Rhodocyclaceae bacterium]
MTHHTLLVLLTLTCLPVPALAADGPVRGATSCGEWVSHRKKSDNLALSNASWLVGFLSGLNVGSNKDLLAGHDNAAIYAWMDNYCNKHPLKDTARGARDLMNEWLQNGPGK